MERVGANDSLKLIFKLIICFVCSFMGFFVCLLKFNDYIGVGRDQCPVTHCRGSIPYHRHCITGPDFSPVYLNRQENCCDMFIYLNKSILNVQTNSHDFTFKPFIHTYIHACIYKVN